MTVSQHSQDIDFKGHKNFTIVVKGEKGDSAVTIQSGDLYLAGSALRFAYYTSFLDATNTNYPNGAIVENIVSLGGNVFRVTYSKDTTCLNTPTQNFQGNSSSVPTPKESLVSGHTTTSTDGVKVVFSATLTSVEMQIYGY